MCPVCPVCGVGESAKIYAFNMQKGHRLLNMNRKTGLEDDRDLRHTMLTSIMLSTVVSFGVQSTNKPSSWNVHLPGMHGH